MSDKGVPEEVNVEENFASDEEEDPDNEEPSEDEDNDAAEPEEDSDAEEPEEDNEIAEGTNCLFIRVCP